MRKIDVHCHASKRVLSDTVSKYATLDVIKSEMKKYDVVNTVVMAAYFPTTGTGMSNFRLHDYIRDEPSMCMFGSLDFEHYFKQGMNELDDLAQRKALNGVKVYTGYQKIDLTSQNFKEIVSFAKSNGLPVAFHTGYYRGKIMNPENLEGVVEKNDGVKFIMCHLARPCSRTLSKMLNEHDNLLADTSGVVYSIDRPDFRVGMKIVERFFHRCDAPENKVLFGTDFPVQTHDDSVRFVENAMKGFSESDKRKVYYENAKNLIRL
jgi:predicted TIM-barrel fold metal-dependent hydrolase